MRRILVIAAALAAFVAIATPASAHDRFTGTVVGVGGGAVSGGFIAGPVGAVVGGVIGGVVGGVVGEHWNEPYPRYRARQRCWRDRWGRTVCEGSRW